MAVLVPATDRQPMHPGALLREDVLPALRISAAEAAQKLVVSRRTLRAILAERATVSPEMALRPRRFCGNGPGIWINPQTKRDLWNAKRNVADLLAYIPNNASGVAAFRTRPPRWTGAQARRAFILPAATTGAITADLPQNMKLSLPQHPAALPAQQHAGAPDTRTPSEKQPR